MTTNQMETQVNTMAETLLEAIQNCTDPDNAQALYSEWVVDGRDPQDGKYEFTFLNELSN
jgi:hypothetical protein